MLSRSRSLVSLGLVFMLSVSTACTSPQHRERAAEQAEFHYNLAIGHWQAREAPIAIRELNTAIELDPTHRQALFLLGFIYQGRRAFAEAERLYRRALVIDPDWHEVTNNLGVVLIETERWAEAEQLYRELTSIPTYATPGHAYNNLGWALLRQGNARDALENFQLAVRFQPSHCLAYNNQGLAHEELGAARAAVRAYEEAIERCADYQEPRYRLAVLLIRLERDPERVQTLMQECVELGVDSTYGQRCDEYVNPDTW